MLKNIILCLVTSILAFTLSSTNLMAQGNNSPAGEGQQKIQSPSPFLITGELPHLTKILMQKWDDSTLHLTEEQKPQLLVVRKETMEGVKKIIK